MAYTARVLSAPVARVFAALVTPETYPRWLIGAAAIRSVDPGWPAIGSRFHHRVGIGPLTVPDITEVADVRPPELLVLHVRARPFVSAYATFRLVPTATGCVVTLEEEPARRVVGNLVRPVLDPLVHIRNHRSLRRLALLLDADDAEPDTTARP